MSTVELFEDDLIRKVLSRVEIGIIEIESGKVGLYLIDGKTGGPRSNIAILRAETEFKNLVVDTFSTPIVSGIKLRNF